MDEWIGRSQALAVLGVKPQTLYAYVSRGQVARRADTADPRCSLYRSDDLLGLIRRRNRGRAAASIAAGVMAWGEPVIATALSTVWQGQLVFRGHHAATLAAHASLEDIAALLWKLTAPPLLVDAGSGDNPFVALAGLVAAAPPTVGRPPDTLSRDAIRCVGAIAGALGARGAGLVHERLARAWRLDAAGADLVRRALVLLADHELNPSTFAVRVAASTGASLPACLLAGLSALSGPRHGGAGAALAGFAAEAERDGAARAVASWLAQGRIIPGFGHKLYPRGDPRSAALLLRLEPDPLLLDLGTAVREAIGAVPNIDFALLALTRQLDLPPDAPFRLFATARAVGWAAHAIEQAQTRSVIRPRATYTGPLPPD